MREARVVIPEGIEEDRALQIIKEVLEKHPDCEMFYAVEDKRMFITSDVFMESHRAKFEIDTALRRIS